jgi:hypothetical protein
MWDTARRHTATPNRTLTRSQPGWPPGLGHTVTKTARNKFLFFTGYPIYGILLQQPEQTKTVMYIKDIAQSLAYIVLIK